ncbi:Protein Shroom1 [Liparis tanakae]|uniref:Protein Shroom1 n=1 Tax=Liparis tanakae TaxID=230148 RepID=A0A4Z2G320_9TELE|nr:Protein Shroom1 [Liparis tanakae]
MSCIPNSARLPPPPIGRHARPFPSHPLRPAPLRGGGEARGQPREGIRFTSYYFTVISTCFHSSVIHSTRTGRTEDPEPAAARSHQEAFESPPDRPDGLRRDARRPANTPPVTRPPPLGPAPSMESYTVRCERMSGVELHPLSLPVSRLSPAKSNGDAHLAPPPHHQHGKGDSAYSSFSGGSTAPDYASPFPPDDLPPAADLKYVKSVYPPPAGALQADAHAVDRLYRSVEAITRRCRDDGYDGKALSKQDGRPAAAAAPARPPPVPTRLDSFTATRNLENGRLHRHGTELQPNALRLRPQKPDPDAVRPSVHAEPLYSVWRGAPPPPPSYRLHLQAHDHAAAPPGPEYLSVAGERQETPDAPERSPPGGHFESRRRRAHSARDRIASEPPPRAAATGPRSAAAGIVNGSIRHKGQFYFVTGVRSPSPSLCGSEAGGGSESAAAPETYRLGERRHSAMDHVSGSRSPGGATPDEREAFSSQSDVSFADQENRRLSSVSSWSSRSVDASEETDAGQNRDIGRHTANNHIFYCGPPPGGERHGYRKREEPLKGGERPPLGDAASERINKETTPLLYQLTGASRAAPRPSRDADFGAKGNDGVPKRAGRDGEERAAPSGDGAPDDPFSRSYREQLQDAQSKVLRETSFKRRDLQLSWPHRARHNPGARPNATHAFSPSLDSTTSTTSTDTLVTSVTSEETERRSVRGEERERREEREPDAGARPPNVAQPQAAPRVGGRRRLTQGQKKMYFSEPEKLHLLGAAPPLHFHAACRSFGEEEERRPEGEPGLVAARRRMFETRGRALSACGAVKSGLKQEQHAALVEYMERKTGLKAGEAAPGEKPPPSSPPRQRLSLGEKPDEWNNNKKSSRPQASRAPCRGRFASAESLLDPPEPPGFRSRSTSTPHAFQALDHEEEPPPAGPMETWRCV